MVCSREVAESERLSSLTPFIISQLSELSPAGEGIESDAGMTLELVVNSRICSGWCLLAGRSIVVSRLQRLPGGGEAIETLSQSSELVVGLCAELEVQSLEGELLPGSFVLGIYISSGRRPRLSSMSSSAP